jgi:hypothetical protein
VTCSEAQALEQIHGYAAANRVRFTRHAWQRMDERNIAEVDALHALKTAPECVAQENGRWKVPGKDLGGDDLTAVVVMEGGVLVVTLF